jgi:hypothetical protein
VDRTAKLNISIDLFRISLVFQIEDSFSMFVICGDWLIVNEPKDLSLEHVCLRWRKNAAPVIKVVKFPFFCSLAREANHHT